MIAIASSETEQAIARQADILALDWVKRVPAKARAQIKSAKRVTFVGTGTSYHAALWAQWLFVTQSRGRLPSRAVATWDLLAELDAGVKPAKGEFFVVVSHRGYRNLTKRALDGLKSSLKGAKTILIASEGSAAGSHALIPTSPPETSQAHTMSLVGAMAAASEVIALLCPAPAAKKLRQDRATAARLLGSLIESRTNADTWELEDLVRPESAVHIVGGGPWHAMALEMALKMREIIHVAAHAYNAEEFLHGPLASVEDKDTLILLPPLSTAGKAAPFLYNDRLSRARAAAEAVGALVIQPHFPDFGPEAARLAPAWQALFSLYWGQVLCVDSARKRKINPDLNRRDDPRYEEARKEIEQMRQPGRRARR